MSRKLIREELKKRGFVVEHESPTMSVFTKEETGKRVILTPAGKWQIYNRRDVGRWSLVLSGDEFSNLLTSLRS